MSDTKIYWKNYEVGLGLGCWLRSRESGVVEGTVRYLAGHLMQAWQVYHRKYRFTDEVWWTPVDKAICHSPEAQRAWRASL